MLGKMDGDDQWDADGIYKLAMGRLKLMMERRKNGQSVWTKVCKKCKHSIPNCRRKIGICEFELESGTISKRK